MALIDLKNATLRLQSGSNHIDISIGEGNLEYTVKRNLEFVKSRGQLYTVRENDEEPCDVTFQFVWDSISSATGSDPPTVEDVLYHTGTAVSWVSTNPDPEAPFCIDITVTYTNSNCPATPTSYLFLQQFNFETLAHSLRDATVDCAGKCNIARPATS